MAFDTMFTGMAKKHYVLKSIGHCLGIEALYKVFPDACIVHTYRNIEEVVPSTCSMYRLMTNSWGPPDDKYGQRIVHALKEYSSKVTRFMKRFDNNTMTRNPMFIVDYKEIIGDPMAVVHKIYDYFHVKLSKTSEKNMLDYIKNNPINKHGKHRYSLEEYGLGKRYIEVQFKEYTHYIKSKISSSTYQW